MFVAWFLALACESDPRTVQVPADPAAWAQDAAFAEARAALSPEEQQALERFGARYLEGGPHAGQRVSTGTEIRHALAEQARWDAQAATEAVARDAEAKAAAQKVARLHEALGVRVTSLVFKPLDWRTDRARDEVHLEVELTNKTTRDIKGFQGLLSLRSKSGEVYRDEVLVRSERLSPQSKESWTHTLEHDGSNKRHRDLITKALSDLDVVWLPEVVAFEDGEVLSAR